MPIVQAINGIVETYPVRPVTPRDRKSTRLNSSHT